MDILDRTRSEIRTMKDSDWSSQEIRELLMRELVAVKQAADDAYVSQLQYVEEVYEELAWHQVY